MFTIFPIAHFIPNRPLSPINEEVWIFSNTSTRGEAPGGLKAPTGKTHLRISNTNSPVEEGEEKVQGIFTPNGTLLTAAISMSSSEWNWENFVKSFWVKILLIAFGRIFKLYWELFFVSSVWNIQIFFCHPVFTWNQSWLIQSIKICNFDTFRGSEFWFLWIFALFENWNWLNQQTPGL